MSNADANDQVRVLGAQAKIAISRRDFALAKHYADTAVALGRQFPVGDYLLGDSLWNAASAEWGLHSLDRAEAGYREALPLMTRYQGADGPWVGQLHGNLAMVMRGQSRYASALDEAQQGLAIDLKALGPDHPRVLTDRGNLGLTEYHLGHYRQARELLEQVAAAQRARAGADSPSQAGTLINLGLVLIEVPDLDAAETALTESLRIWEKNYGREFAGAQAALGSLGNVQLLKGQLALAETELTEVRDTMKSMASRMTMPTTICSVKSGACVTIR